ncbi:hypothetical protein [Aquimarina sp. 2304DJ70-9]|uniref:hypothetical protein n=1 Tax=Aquimarina penaris TaxID=3231044 RepID=UPI00346252B9
MKKTKTKSSHRVIALFFTLTFLQTLIPYNQLWANNNGPTAPEAASFEPVDATDMVNLLTGDMSYVLPILNVPSPEGGYPLALSYHAGIANDQEASWVGLGWNLNPGAINRRLNKVPDDWYKARTYNILSSGVNTNYRGSVSINVGTDKIGGSIGLYVNLSENRAFNGETEYRTDVGVTGGLGIGGKDSPFSINGSLGTDGISAGLGFTGLSKGSGANAISTATGFNVNASLSQSFINGSTSFSVSSSFGTGFSLSSTNGLGVSVLGKPIGVNNSNIGSQASNISTRHYGVPLYLINLNLSIQKAWLFERDYTINQGSLYSGDMKKVLDEAIFTSKVDYDGYESINPNNAFEESTKGNFSNVSYDNYSVSGQGVSGTMKPYIFEKKGYIFNKETLLNAAPEEFSSLVGYYPEKVHFEKNVNGVPQKDIHFYFDNEFSSYLNVDSGNWKTDQLIINNPAVLDFDTLNNTFQTSLKGNDTYNDNTSRWKKGNYVEVFTNEEINANPRLVLTTPGFNRNNSTLIPVPEKGIGAYKITMVDGKTYHYTIPVYQHEQFSKTAHKDYAIEENFSENQQLESYATHWLLTGVTGPDYIDVDNDNALSKGDYGYWVSFEYGKWSDGYMWRTPKVGERVFENTKTYSWGVKDIYYLNKIKTRTHTALFIKEDRKDNNGSAIHFPSENPNDFKRYEDVHYDSRNRGSDGEIYFNGIYEDQLSSVGVLGLGLSYYDVNFNIKSHKTLRLDKIVVVKNNSDYSGMSLSHVNESVDQSIGSIKIKTEFLTYDTAGRLISTKNKGVHNRKWKGEFYKNILDTKDIINNAPNLYEDAVEVIDFNYDETYPLASSTPNSTAASKGRLTLKSVSTLGKKGKSLIPPYKFDYFNKSISFDKENTDSWGYYQGSPAAWSLNEIVTPTGGKVTIEYENDVYKEIVPSSRIFSDKLRFMFTGDIYGNKYVYLSNEVFSTEKIDFREYFDTNSTAYVDVLYWRHPPGNSSHRIGDVAKHCTVSQVHEDLVVFKIPNIHYSPNVRRGVNCERSDWVYYAKVEETYNAWFTKTDANSCGDPRHTSNGTRVRYKFHSNKKPANDIIGGGIRVKQLIVSNGDNEKYKSRYSYTNPITGSNSGTTSYAPAEYTKNIPFLSELPAPSVLYQYVNVEKYSTNNTRTGVKRYKFNTIQGFANLGNGFVMDNFLSLKEDQNENKISTIPTQPPVYLGTNFTRHRLEDNTSAIGSLVYSKEFNSENQLISSTENEYGFDSSKQGFVQETFRKVKLHVLSGAKNLFVNASSKLKKQTILKQSKVTQNNSSFITSYEKHDPFSGKLLEQLQTLSDGTIYNTKSIPAYTKYSPMGNKVDNTINKNMLTQEAANLTQIKINNAWKTIGADIATWDNNWTYRNTNGTTSTPTTNDQKIWRKHKTYTWKGDVDSDGAYVGYTGDFDSFNWGNTAQTNPKWINTSTINLYDHFSMPLESTDINKNNVSTRTGDNHSKIIAVANARYTSMYYTGAEYYTENSGNTYFDGGVKTSGNVIVDPNAHTGTHIVQVNGGPAFEVILPPDPDRVGIKSKFKVAVWVRKGQENKVSLMVQNGDSFPFVTDFNANETITAGDWVLVNGYIDIGTSQAIVTVESTGTIDLDDFRLHPVSSGMTSYVYNEWDELTHIMGANNLATKYQYDDAGRLKRIYAEVIDAPGMVGGFKKSQETNYNYKR